MLALWAEQDVIVADEFRDGNVPAGSGNLRLVEKALGALPGGMARRHGVLPARLSADRAGAARAWKQQPLSPACASTM